jgi:PAS domain S-box-containing protein
MDFKAFEATPGVSVIVSPDSPVFTYVAVSNDFIRTSGMKRSDVIGKGHFQLFPKSPDDPNFTGELNLRASFEYILQHKEPHKIPLQRYDVPNTDGTFSHKYWKVNNAPILSDAGEVLYIIHSAVDITDQILAEQKVESSKGIEKAYHFFINAPVIIGFVKGVDYVIELANEGLLEVWGRTPEVIGKPLFKAIPELEKQGFKELLDQVCVTGNPFYAYEYPIRLMRNGKEELFYFDFIYKPIYENGTKDTECGVISVGHDVTEKVLARKRVKESEEKYHTLFNTMDQGFCVLDIIFDEANNPVDYRFIETNPVFEKQTGLENAIGKTALELVPGLEPHWFELYGKVALTGEAIRFVEGSQAMGRWFEVYAFPINYNGSKKVALLFTDISERKKAEEALKLSESNLRNMILQSPVAMAILRGPNFVVELANDRMFELFGRGRDEVINKSIFDGLPEVKNQGYEELLTGVYTTGKTFSAFGIPVTLPRHGGLEKVYVNLLYEALREGDGSITGIMVVAIDVTDQVVARMKVEESNKELQFAMNVMPQMVWVTLADGYHDFYNKHWYDYTGLSHEESKNTGWNTVLHPDDQERAWKVWRHSLETSEPYEIEYRFKRYDGAYRWFLGRALPLKDKSGNILKWFGTCTDIDDQKKAAQVMEETVKARTQELKVTIRELERSNANLEDFAYAASHDLKEPVRKIRTFSDRIKSHLKGEMLDEVMNYFVRMDKATERMQNLIDDLLEYSQVATNHRLLEEIDLNKKIRQVLEDLELEVAEKQANIIMGQLPVLKGHRRQLEQLFQNLITNALKFSKPGVAPEIRINASVQKGESIAGFRISPDSKNKLYHLITVADNGIGFEQEYADKIFKMFQRLHGKAEYDGTGIGLAIARKVVENHHGFIITESKLGEGATFKILLPIE